MSIWREKTLQPLENPYVKRGSDQKCPSVSNRFALYLSVSTRADKRDDDDATQRKRQEVDNVDSTCPWSGPSTVSPARAFSKR